MPNQSRHQREAPLPLAVDLDNSLLAIDVLAEYAIRLAFLRPILFLRLMLKRRDVVYIKSQLAQNFSIRPEILPYNQKVIELMRERQAKGGKVILATASVPEVADPIAVELGIEDVISSRDFNMKAGSKRDALVDLYGKGGFDYVGDSRSDLPVWRAAQGRYFAGNSSQISELSRKLNTELIDISQKKSWRAISQGLRPSHWVKNLLLAVPLVLAGNWSQTPYLALASTFIGFCFVASGLYLFNDLLDVDADRAHPEKRFRPIAHGQVSALKAVIWSGCLVLSGFLASLLGAGLLGLGLTTAYALGSLVYSLKLKTIPYIDVLGLAGLYVYRIVAGALVTSTFVSYWMMLFALMTFAALASLKRMTELSGGTDEDRRSLFLSSRRGYRASDLESVRSLAAGFTVSSIALLGIYAQEAFSLELQSIASLLLVSTFAIWLLKFWLDANRGRLSHDPIKHAMTDRTSVVLLAVTFGLYFWLNWSF